MSFSDVSQYLIFLISAVVRMLDNIKLGGISLMSWSVSITVLGALMVILVRSQNIFKSTRFNGIGKPTPYESRRGKQ